MSAAIKEIYSWVDGRINVKGVYRRLQVVARLLVVGTFADDSLRVACDYSGQVSTMGSVGFHAPLSSILPAVFILTQGISVFLIISELAPEPGCITLLLWTGLHPFIYKQESNLEFLLESITIMGGLMVLLSSERQNRKARERKVLPSAAPTPEETAEEANKMNLLQLCGRVCISAVFLYYSGKMMHERVQGISKGLASQDENLVQAVFEGVLMVFLLLLTGFLVAGMKSRWCALLLALIMTLSAMYKHPWFITMWSKSTFALDFVVGYEDTYVDAWLYSDHQRYFFFQQLSTVGALLQLVVHGPGQYSMDESDGPVQVIALTTKGTD
eukprot:Transcript_5802.p1 GENE.Transcript_5802~~Transcript_5802.p1  ORF type:complete len:328 (+),score=154.20 Transcript_5802:206-1189(+)